MALKLTSDALGEIIGVEAQAGWMAGRVVTWSSDAPKTWRRGGVFSPHPTDYDDQTSLGIQRFWFSRTTISIEPSSALFMKSAK
jgi:hypothetical protein